MILMVILAGCAMRFFVCLHVGRPQGLVIVDFASKTTNSIWKFTVQVIVIDILHLTIPHHGMGVSMTFIQLSIGDHFAIIASGTIDTKSIQGIAKQG